MEVHYNIVKHPGHKPVERFNSRPSYRWVVEINEVLYDDPTKFERDFPRDQHTTTKFSPGEDMDFSWDEMHRDMVVEWGNEDA